MPHPWARQQPRPLQIERQYPGIMARSTIERLDRLRAGNAVGIQPVIGLEQLDLGRQRLVIIDPVGQPQPMAQDRDLATRSARPQLDVGRHVHRWQAAPARCISAARCAQLHVERAHPARLLDIGGQRRRHCRRAQHLGRIGRLRLHLRVEIAHLHRLGRAADIGDIGSQRLRQGDIDPRQRLGVARGIGLLDRPQQSPCIIVARSQPVLIGTVEQRQQCLRRFGADLALVAPQRPIAARAIEIAQLAACRRPDFSRHARPRHRVAGRWLRSRHPRHGAGDQHGEDQGNRMSGGAAEMPRPERKIAQPRSPERGGAGGGGGGGQGGPWTG